MVIGIDATEATFQKQHSHESIEEGQGRDRGQHQDGAGAR